MRVRFFGCFALLTAAAFAPAAPIVITFDDLVASSGGVPGPNNVVIPFDGRTVPANYALPYLTFTVSNNSGLFVYRDAQYWQGANNTGATLPNIVCATAIATASSAVCNETLLLSFVNPVNNLSFLSAAWDDVGSTLRVEVFTSATGANPTVVTVVSPRNSAVIKVVDLSTFANVTAVRLITPSLTGTPAGDTNGFVFDNFSFELPVTTPPNPPNPPNPPASVPEPSTALSALAGLGLLAWRRFAVRR